MIQFILLAGVIASITFLGLFVGALMRPMEIENEFPDDEESEKINQK